MAFIEANKAKKNFGMWESDFKWYGQYPDLFPSVYSNKSGLFSILQNHCKKAKYTTQKLVTKPQFTSMSCY